MHLGEILAAATPSRIRALMANVTAEAPNKCVREIQILVVTVSRRHFILPNKIYSSKSKY